MPGDVIFANRAPRFPLECFHGNCYSEMVDLEEQDGYFVGLQLNLLVDGNHYTYVLCVFYYYVNVSVA